MELKLRLDVDSIFEFIGSAGIGGLALYQMMLRDIYGASRFVLYAFSAMCILCILYCTTKKVYSINKYKEVSLLIAFHFYVLFASLFSTNIGGAISYWINYSQDYIIVLTVVALLSLNKSSNLSLKIIAVGAVVLVCFMLFVPSMRYGGARFRLSEDSNSNGLGLMFAFGIWMLMYVSKNNTFGFVVVSVASVMAALATILTGSRKSLILLALFFILFIYSYLKAAKGIKKIIIIIIMIACSSYVASTIVSAFMGSSISSRFSETFTGTSDTARIKFYVMAFKLFLKNPIFGCGYQGFRYYYSSVYSHSSIAELLVTGGIIGTVLYTASFIVIFKKIKSIRQRIKSLKFDDVNIDTLNSINYRASLVFALGIALIVLSTVIIYFYITIYQIYIAMLIYTVNLLDAELRKFEYSYYGSEENE